jgi:hypothetical protein
MTVEREREERLVVGAVCSSDHAGLLAELETGCEDIESPAHRPSAPLARSGGADTVARNIHPGGSLEGLRCR